MYPSRRRWDGGEREDSLLCLERKHSVAYSFGGGLRLRRVKLPVWSQEVLTSKTITLSVAPSRPLALREGDTVGRGGLVAEPFEGQAARYSGIGGIVHAIREEENGKTVVIVRDATVPDAEPLPPVEERLADMTEESLRTLLLARGVTPPDAGEKALKHLIVDCTGDDPFNESRAALCRACAGDVVGGAKILMKLLTVRQTVFSVSEDRTKVADELNAYIPAKSRMLRTEVVRSKFPQAVPHLLVSSLFDLEINSGIPMSKTGYAVVSPMLCKAVFDALAKGIPYTDATVTLAEEPLTSGHIRVLTVPFGTPLSEVLTLCGRTLQENERLTTGGGYRALPALPDDPVTADTEAVSLLAVKTKKRLGICIGCGRCGDACPMRLNPAILYEAAMADRRKAARRLDIDACIGCGTCTASCPAGIPLAETITAYRAEITGGSDEG